MAIYGYMRVSSTDQNEDRQRITLEELGISQKNISLTSFQGKTSNVRNIRG